MTLTYRTQVRREDDATICETLIRKGWVENEPPSYNPATHSAPTWDGSVWTTVALPPPPPANVSMTSLRLALIDAGLYQTVTSAINSIADATEKLKAQTWWSTAQTVRREHPLVAGIAALAGRTDAQVDAIFAAAQALDNPTP